MKCESKRKFESEKESNNLIEVSLKKFNIKQYSYKCPNCGFYHLTSNSPQKEKQLAKVRQNHRILKESEYWESKFKPTNFKKK